MQPKLQLVVQPPQPLLLVQLLQLLLPIQPPLLKLFVQLLVHLHL